MTIQFCTFRIDHQLYGVEVTRVIEVMRHAGLTPVPLSRNPVAGLMNLRGQIVAAVDLRTVLGQGPLEGVSLNVVIRNRDEMVSLLVDEIADVIDVETDDFEPTPSVLPAVIRAVVTGTYKLAGELLLVLDVDSATACTVQAVA
jgi:purine-binding chemotaxis protein CheW